MSARLRPIAEIRIGKRIRKDMGDVQSLAESIEDLGLLHPVLVTPDGLLLSGERRLRAAKLLGWTEIPVPLVEAK
jgi:ParB family transcriptional regulator, chromosome partitioning protein